MNNQTHENAKKTNKFVAFLKNVFVHNIGWKLLSIFAAAVIWALAAGLPAL
ncbi:MAG: hypothetical protein K2L88_00235 [Clostridiales bacterium]|nr:hypothetical protein [Clostridiales bacterium]